MNSPLWTAHFNSSVSWEARSIFSGEGSGWKFSCHYCVRLFLLHEYILVLSKQQWLTCTWQVRCWSPPKDLQDKLNRDYTSSIFQAGCPSCHPDHSVKKLDGKAASRFQPQKKARRPHILLTHRDELSMEGHCTIVTSFARMWTIFWCLDVEVVTTRIFLKLLLSLWMSCLCLHVNCNNCLDARQRLVISPRFNFYTQLYSFQIGQLYCNKNMHTCKLLALAVTNRMHLKITEEMFNINQHWNSFNAPRHWTLNRFDYCYN